MRGPTSTCGIFLDVLTIDNVILLPRRQGESYIFGLGLAGLPLL